MMEALLKTFLGLQSGCKKMAEFQIFGKVPGELLDSANGLFFWEKLGDSAAGIGIDGLQKFGSHLWRVELDGAYVDDLAPDNDYAAVVVPGDGFVYAADRDTGNLIRMNLDGTAAKPQGGTLAAEARVGRVEEWR